MTSTTPAGVSAIVNGQLPSASVVLGGALIMVGAVAVSAATHRTRTAIAAS